MPVGRNSIANVEWQWRGELTPLTSRGMMKGQLPGVQTKTSLNGGSWNGDFPNLTVAEALRFHFAFRNAQFDMPMHFIANNGMANVSAMDSQLIRASGHRL